MSNVTTFWTKIILFMEVSVSRSIVSRLLGKYLIVFHTLENSAFCSIVTAAVALFPRNVAVKGSEQKKKINIK